MRKLTDTQTRSRMFCGANRELRRLWEWYAQQACTELSRVTLLAAAIGVSIMLSACGGTRSSGDPQPSATLSGNWQFTMAPQTDGNPNDATFSGGLQGGFLLQNNDSASGQTVYSVTSSTFPAGPCNGGSAPIAVKISGQNITLTEVAGTQTFTLTGTLSSDGSTMMGTYTSTAGTAADGSPCGYAETGLSWNAVKVPPLTGTITGSFHSTAVGTSLTNQDFAVSGTLTQSPNIGASNATVTGTLTFIDPLTNLSDYPCFPTASVNGQISGNFVILQLVGTNGATVGQIGEPVSLSSSTGINPLTFDSVQGGYILHGLQPTYMVATKNCPGSLAGATLAGDVGNFCLGLNSANACQQPITLSPGALIFPAQALNSPPTMQSIAISNNSSATLSGLTLSLTNITDINFNGESDFNGEPAFTETDACGAGGAPSQGQPFDLGPGQSCAIAVTFSPQESCPWLPFPNSPSINGASPEWCPFPQSATLTVASPSSADEDTLFAASLTGIGLSAIQPSTSELDFSAEEQLNPPEASLPQTLSFTNNGANPVQILGGAPCTNAAPNSHNILPSPRLASSPVAGLQVVSNDVYQILPDLGTTPSTITYRCDSDSGTALANIQISLDTCTGAFLAPQASCSLQVRYSPQPNTDVNSGLDYFLELNTVQCWPIDSAPVNCEIDSGRFPVELRANPPSPLRMLPGAGLDFGAQKKGAASAPMTITILNDPTLTNPQTVTFVGKILVQGNYSETDDCPVTLAPGGQCTLTVTFTPSGAGFSPGKLTINYSPEPNGSPQFVYLRGTGQ